MLPTVLPPYFTHPGVVQILSFPFIFEEGRASSRSSSRFGQRKGRRGWVFLTMESLKGGDRKKRKISLCVPPQLFASSWAMSANPSPLGMPIVDALLGLALFFSFP